MDVGDIGTVYANPDEAHAAGGIGAMFLRINCGTAQKDDKRWELSTAANGSPIIYSCQTRRWFAVSWNDLLTLAIERGIENLTVTPDDLISPVRPMPETKGNRR